MPKQAFTKPPNIGFYAEMIKITEPKPRYKDIMVDAPEILLECTDNTVGK